MTAAADFGGVEGWGVGGVAASCRMQSVAAGILEGFIKSVIAPLALCFMCTS